MVMSVGFSCAATAAEVQQGSRPVLFACSACDSPAITLPEEFHDRAPVHCQGCGLLVATWAVFKQTATRAILSEVKRRTGRAVLGPDPLDDDLLRAERAAHVPPTIRFVPGGM